VGRRPRAVARHARCYAHGSMARLALVAAFLLASVPAFAAPPKPSAPPPGGPPAKTAAEAADPTALRRGVVQVERAGRPVAIGTVLANDGRVLTALSALGTSEQLDVRYDDGSVVKTRVGHKDASWDLALLIPQTGKWLDGLSPTNRDPAGTELNTFLPKGKKLGSHAVGLKGRTDARSKTGEALKSVLEVDLKGAPNVVGAPILEPTGHVVGVLVRACKEVGAEGSAAEGARKPEPKAGDAGGPACTPVTVGAPVYALRGFLMKTPATAVAPAPWLGLGGAAATSGNVRGVRVMGIAPGSPAEKAGLKLDEQNPETIVAVDGQPVESPEQLAEVISKRAIGQQIKLLVFSGGKFREVPVTLRAAP
jgi:serine protease Do